MLTRTVLSLLCLFLVVICASINADQTPPQYTLPPLPYEYNALEPYIGEKTMRIHHDKHHQAYLSKFLELLAKLHEGYPQLAHHTSLPLLEFLRLAQYTTKLPVAFREQFKNQGGGYYNHNLFWKIMQSPKKDSKTGQIDQNYINTPLSGSFVEQHINSAWGDLATFQTAFKAQATALFGSGWTWVVAHCNTHDEVDTILIENKPNQDVPQRGVPILALDVFEHAYYLDYQNNRATYVDNFFKLINWDQVNSNLIGACKATAKRFGREEL